MPDLNHSGIYNTQNSQQTYAWKSLFESCRTRMSDNKLSQWRAWINANIALKKQNTPGSKLMCAVVFLKESDFRLWQSQTIKITKANWTSKTNTWCQHHACTPTCVTFDMIFATPESNSFALLFLKQNLLQNTAYNALPQKIMCNKIGWKANIRRKGGKNVSSAFKCHKL